MMRSRVLTYLVGGMLLGTAGAASAWLSGCQKTALSHREGGAGRALDAEGGVCPEKHPAPRVLPGVTGPERTAGYWIAKANNASEVLLSPSEIRDHNAALLAWSETHAEEDRIARYDLAVGLKPARLRSEVAARLAFLREQATQGRYLNADGSELSSEQRRALTMPAGFAAGSGRLKIALEEVRLRCGPLAGGLFKGPTIDPAFDRNNCSTIRAQEPLRIIGGRWPGGMRLAVASYAMGWIEADAKLSPEVPSERVDVFVGGSHVSLLGGAALKGKEGRSTKLAPHVALPRDRDGRMHFATSEGFDRAAMPSGARQSPRPLTRAALLEEAFRFLDTPYGWGGQSGGRDCSRFVMDVLASFGLEMPRHSSAQAKAGSFTIDVSPLKKASERVAMIDAAAARGVVLLHFPGHIMLYLGRGESGRPMAIHAFAEYLQRCPTGGETLRTVDRIQVSDLSLGEGTSRRSFIERLKAVTVLGRNPGSSLVGAATRRAAAPPRPQADCQSEKGVSLWVSPRRPHPGAPLRVVVSSSHDLGPVAMTLEGPAGARHQLAVQRVGGPPFGYWGELPAPRVGKWTVRLGDGSRQEACQHVTVHEKGDIRQGNHGVVWRPRRRWTPATENLFSTWVERLFDYPLDDRTWGNLQGLLGKREQNLLFNHLGQGEDENLRLQPDCADLPYFLRAYFAWKMRLPFSYRRCNRGFAGKAPYCDGKTYDHLVSVEAATEVSAFSQFARRNIADSVHSGSGRAGADSNKTDYYPLPLTREALRPGVIFADPYGHLFVIAEWIPQGVSGYGVLVGADAQPDGTIGRRRFWPGSFLFTPDTREAAAGFKGFRPARYRGGRIRPYKNSDIAGLGLPPFSMQQYTGSKDDFYDTVGALINPRPLDPKAMLQVLIAAFHEQVKRRVVSVQNAEDYLAKRRGAIDMPRGHAIFETTGAWENYSTPSRDMRLLIAMDTVLGFVAGVRRQPARYNLTAAAVGPAADQLEAYLRSELSARGFGYRSSGGDTQKLNLSDVVARAQAFEMAYNPNDCVELRWAAPEGGEELRTCRRRAPAVQRRRMASYRPWFAERRRPPR